MGSDDQAIAINVSDTDIQYGQLLYINVIYSTCPYDGCDMDSVLTLYHDIQYVRRRLVKILNLISFLQHFVVSIFP